MSALLMHITKRQAVIIVSVSITILLLLIKLFPIVKDFCIVMFLSVLAGAAVEMRDGFFRSWESIPGLMKIFMPKFEAKRDSDAQDRFELPFAEFVDNAVVRLMILGSTIRAASGRLRRGVHDMLALWTAYLIGCLKRLRGLYYQDRANNGWCSFLVRTPPVNDYGSLNHKLAIHNSSGPGILWQSRDTSSIPSIDSPLTFQAHISFCLVEKTVWENPNLTILEKLAEGLYWDVNGQNQWNSGVSWSHEKIRRISAVEILGSAGGAHDTVEECHRYFASLRQGWEYLDIYWNDVDFAIILGLLVTGTCAAQKSRHLFDSFWSLRIKHVMETRTQIAVKGLLIRWCIVTGAAIVTAGTGGLVAPLFTGGCLTDLGFGIAGTVISVRDAGIWKQRHLACQELHSRFPQLHTLFGTQPT